MVWRRFLRRLGCGLVALGVLYAFQRPFREYNGVEYRIGDIPLPPDFREDAEWTFARLMFPGGWNDGYRGRFDGDFRLGLSLWTQDFPRADRHFSRAVRRLSRIQARSVEQSVNLDGGDGYDWPWLYAVQVGEWGLTDRQASELREYLLRGGFFMADDFHGATEYRVFEERMQRVFPERSIVDIPDGDAIFHTVYDLDERYQIPGQAHLRLGYKYADGKGAHWRAIYDDKGRVMVAISFNSDIGDAWEWADDPYYPERFSDLAIRLGLNYVVYAMSH
jgi:hypothetical protein